MRSRQRGARVTTPDGLPPLRDVIRASGLSRQEEPRPELPARFQSDAPHRPRRRSARRRDHRRDRPRPWRPHSRPADRRRVPRRRHREGRALPARAARHRRALSGPARRHRRRCAGGRLRRAPPPRAPARIVANLPYSVAHASAHRLAQDRAVAALVRPARADVPARGGRPHRRQAEDARITAGSRCFAQWRTRPAHPLHPSGRGLHPAPQGRFCRWSNSCRAKTPKAACDVRRLERVTAAAFGQRRKMLRSSLRQLTPDSETLLASLGIEPKARAEELGVTDFCRIANALQRG